MSKIFKKLNKVASKLSPLDYITKNNPDNKLVSVLEPFGAARTRIDRGDDTSTVLDPGQFFTASKSKTSRDKVAAVEQEEADAKVEANKPLSPTYSSAAQSNDQSARSRRRRGVLANIFAGKKTGSLAGQQQVLG